MTELAYVNGEFLPLKQATVSAQDRGFLFADGVYEVSVTYNGRPFLLERHLARLRRSLRELLFDVDIGPEGLGIETALREGIRRAGFAETHVYIQITRGVAPRRHHFPEPRPIPTVVMFFTEAHLLPESAYEQGYRAVTAPDERWRRRDIKSVSLLPNILAREQAARAGAQEALLVDDDGFITEGAGTSSFCVIDGAVYTRPSGPEILPSITRGLLIELAQAEGIPLHQQCSTVEHYRTADEIFIAGTSLAAMPILQLDGAPVGTGQRGPLTRAVRQAYLRYREAAPRL